MYSKQQKEIALKLYHQTESVSETVRILGYPTRKNLYNWIYEEKHPTKVREDYPIIDNPPDHPRNPSLQVKLDAIHRCYELGENIKYVSEDIGYSRASIYQWRKRYLKEGTLGLMNNKCLFLRKCTVVPEERIPLFRSKYTVRPEQDTACIILASASLLA